MTQKTRKFLFIGLTDGVRAGNLATHYYASLFGLSLLLFFGVIQPFVMTSLLRIPQAEQGGITGKLGVLNELTLLILTPLFGIISDRIGRKPVFVFGFIAIGIAAILYSFLDSVSLLFAFRVSAAVGSAAISGMFSTVIADYVVNRDRGKATGLMGFFNGLGAMLAVLLLLNLPGMFVKRGNEFDTALIMTFYVVSGIALASSVVLMVGLKGGLASAESEKKSFVSLAKEGLFAARDPRILLAYAAAFVSRGDLALVGSFLTLWLNKYGIQSGMTETDAARQVSLGIVIVQSIALLAAPVVGLMADRLHAVTAVGIAALVAAIGYGSLFFIQNPFGTNMKLALALVGFGEIAGVITSQVLIAKYARSEIRGSVIGFFGLCGAVGIMTAFGVGGYLFDHWRESAPFLLFGIFGIIVAGLGLWVRDWSRSRVIMKTVVITGSTRGIGFGMADEFLKRQCKVVISGRTMGAVERAVNTLGEKHGRDNVFGVPCDVSKHADNQGLWDASVAHFGKVDVWINNAGISNAYVPFWQVPAETVESVTDTNLLGAMNGCHVAIREMIAIGGGQVYNMYGFGSDGRKSDGLALYGATKYGLKYLTEALSEEVKETPVVVASLSPGIVTTDMWDDLYASRASFLCLETARFLIKTGLPTNSL